MCHKKGSLETFLRWLLVLLREIGRLYLAVTSSPGSLLNFILAPEPKYQKAQFQNRSFNFIANALPLFLLIFPFCLFGH